MSTSLLSSLCRAVLRVTLAACALGVSGCAAMQPQFDGRVQEIEGVRFRIIDTGYTGRGWVWYSDRQLLLNGSPNASAEAMRSDPTSGDRFFLLDTSGMKGLEIGLRPLIACVDADRIRYVLQSEGPKWVQTRFEGRPGEAKAVEAGILMGPDDKIDWFGCRPKPDLTQLKPPAGWVIRDALREGDGYLVRQEVKTDAEFYNASIGWWPGPGHRVIDLEVRSRNIYLMHVRYLPWAKKYVLSVRDSSGSIDRPREMRWLTLDPPSASAMSIPTGLVHNWGENAPVKHGILLEAGPHTITRSGPIGDGAYLFVNGKVIRLLSGNVGALPISPDGCRAAVAYEPLTRKVTPPSRLLIIDFCV